MSKTAPSEIERIFDKPGRKWSPNEKLVIKTWLNVEPQLSYLLGFIFRRLRASTNEQDAEEAWQDFCVPEKDLDWVIKSYDPSEGRRFWNYLLFWLDRYSWRRNQRNQRRHPGAMQEEFDESKHTDRRLARSPEQEAEAREAGAVLLRCLEIMNDNDRLILEKRYLEEKSISEIAKELGIREEVLKVRLHRAKLKLREYLRREGVDYE